MKQTQHLEILSEAKVLEEMLRWLEPISEMSTLATCKNAGEGDTLASTMS